MGAKSGRVTSGNIHRLQVFVNRCLRKILKVFWPNVISNDELWNKTNEEPIHPD